jgi:hypothetical protein
LEDGDIDSTLDREGDARRIWAGRDLFVKEIAHRIDENAPPLTPEKRLRQTIGSQCEVEAVFERMSDDATKAF